MREKPSRSLLCRASPMRGAALLEVGMHLHTCMYLAYSLLISSPSAQPAASRPPLSPADHVELFHLKISVTWGAPPRGRVLLQAMVGSLTRTSVLFQKTQSQLRKARLSQLWLHDNHLTMRSCLSTFRAWFLAGGTSVLAWEWPSSACPPWPLCVPPWHHFLFL